MSVSVRFRSLKSLSVFGCSKRLCNRESSDFVKQHCINGFQVTIGCPNFRITPAEDSVGLCVSISFPLSYTSEVLSISARDKRIGMSASTTCMSKEIRTSPIGILQTAVPRDLVFPIPIQPWMNLTVKSQPQFRHKNN